MSKKKNYTKGDLTVHWNPDVCIHSTNCVKNLSSVFNSKGRPWINIDGADAKDIMSAIRKCPSGALGYTHKGETYSILDQKQEAQEATTLKLSANGPIQVEGSFRVQDADGNEVPVKKKVFLCRCGGSSNKPFCDGTHNKNGFAG